MFKITILIIAIIHGDCLRRSSPNYWIQSNKVFSQFTEENFLDLKYLKKPEVLSPAGGWAQLRSAVANGADAVYFGLKEGFNARARASNFDIDELEIVMNYLHDAGVKGYLVVNILVFEKELTRLQSLIQKISKAGVDALIMQVIYLTQFCYLVVYGMYNLYAICLIYRMSELYLLLTLLLQIYLFMVPPK